MESILDNGAKFLPQTNRKRLHQKTAGFTDMVSAYHREFSETSDIFTRKDEEDFYDKQELRLKANELAQSRPDILQVIKGDLELSDTDFINSDPIAVINSIRPEVMDEIKEAAKEKLKTHIESARQNTQMISEQYREGDGSLWGEVGAGFLAYAGTGEGIAQLILGAGLSSAVGSTTRAGAITAGNIGRRAARVGAAEGIISLGLEIPLAASEYNRDIGLGLDQDYARTNMYLRLIAAPAFGAGAGAGISYLVDKIRFRGGTKAILSESGKEQIFRAFEITEGRIGAIEAINNISGKKIKTDGKAADWADQIERTGTITLTGKDFNSPAQRANIVLEDGEKIVVGEGGTAEKVGVKETDTSERKPEKINPKFDDSQVVGVKDDDHIIVGQEPEDVVVLSKQERDKHNINKDSLVLFHGSVRPWDVNEIDMYKFIGTGEGTTRQFQGLYASPSKEAAETYTTGFRWFKKTYGRILPPLRPRLYKIEVDKPDWIGSNEPLPLNAVRKLEDLQERMDKLFTPNGNISLITGLRLEDLFNSITHRYGGKEIGKKISKLENEEAVRQVLLQVSKDLESIGFTGIRVKDIRNKGGNEYILFNKKHIREITDAKRGKIIYRRPAEVITDKNVVSIRIGKEGSGLTEAEIAEIKSKAITSKKENVRGEMETKYYFEEDVDLPPKVKEIVDDNEVYVVKVSKNDLSRLKKQYEKLLIDRLGNGDDAKQTIAARVRAIDNAIIKEDTASVEIDTGKVGVHWQAMLTHPEMLFGKNGNDFLNIMGMTGDVIESNFMAEDALGLSFIRNEAGESAAEKIDDIANIKSDGVMVFAGADKKRIAGIYVVDDNTPLPKTKEEAVAMESEILQKGNQKVDSNSEGTLEESIIYISEDGNGAIVFVNNKGINDWLGAENAVKLQISMFIKNNREQWGNAPMLSVAKVLSREYTKLSSVKEFYKRHAPGTANEVIDLANEADFMRAITTYSYKELVDALGNDAASEKVYNRIQYYVRKTYKNDKGKNKSNKKLNDEAHKFVNALIRKADMNKGNLVINENEVKYFRLAATQIDDIVKIQAAAENMIKLVNMADRVAFNDVKGKAFTAALYKGDFSSFDKKLLNDLASVREEKDILKVINNHLEKVPYDLESGKIVVGDKLFTIVKEGDNFSSVKETAGKVIEGKPLESTPILTKVDVKGKGVVEVNFLYAGKTDKMVLRDYTIKKDSNNQWVLRKNGYELNRYNDKDVAIAEMLKDKYNKLKELPEPDDLENGIRQYNDPISGNVYKESVRGDTLILTDKNDVVLKRFENNDNGRQALKSYMGSKHIIASDVDNNKKFISDIEACVVKFKG